MTEDVGRVGADQRAFLMTLPEARGRLTDATAHGILSCLGNSDAVGHDPVQTQADLVKFDLPTAEHE